MAMTEDQLEEYIQSLVKIDKLWKFYKQGDWLVLREEVLKEHQYECQKCKTRGIHTRAEMVHHVQWVKKYPRLALSRTYWYQGIEYKQLIPLCNACHNEEHPEKGFKKNKPRFTNEERW